MGGFIAGILNFLSGGIASRIVDAFIAHDAAKQAALNDTQRLAFQERQEARAAALQIRLATANFWEMRFLTFAIAAPFVLHLWLVGYDTMFPQPWNVEAWPSPFDEWEGAILLSFFGVAGGVGAVKAVAGAIASGKVQRRSGNLLTDALRQR